MADYELLAKQVIRTAEAQVGKPCGKTSEYAAELDKVNFYNYPKNGVANSCKIFVDDMIYRNIKPQTAHNARAAVYEPDKDNCGAGCAQAVEYFKSHDAWITKHSDAQSGDEIFFKRNSAVSKSNPLGVYHTGLVVTWDKKGFYVVEGNTTYEGKSGMVARKFYPYGDSRIAGFGRPNYTGWDVEEKPAEKPSEDPEPTPAPEKPSKSVDELAKEVIQGKWGNGKDRADRLTKAGYNYQAVQDRVNEMLGYKPQKNKYTVKVNSWLNIRNAPNGMIIGRLFNGDKVTVSETVNGWGKIGDNRWVSMTYLH